MHPIQRLMHQLSYALVQADTKAAALKTARTVFDEVLESDRQFDYYGTFDQSGNPVVKQSPWSDLPAAALIDSEDGESLLTRGLDAMLEATSTDPVRHGAVFYDHTGAPLETREDVEGLVTGDAEYWIVPADIHH